MKPSRFVVEYQDADAVAEESRKAAAQGGEPEDYDPSLTAEAKSFDTLEEARKFKRQHEGESPIIYERKNIRDVTPRGDPRGLLWEWDTEMVED